MNKLNVQGVKVMMVVQVESREGDGADEPIRPVYSYWNPEKPDDGPLATYDSWKANPDAARLGRRNPAPKDIPEDIWDAAELIRKWADINKLPKGWKVNGLGRV